MPDCESELKRLQAINNKKKEFDRKQEIIRNALKEVDKKSTNKIIFDYDNEPDIKKRKKSKSSNLVLFDSDDEDVELTGHEFDIKPKIDDELIKLQAKYNNDKRFILDERFNKHNEESEENETNNIEEDEEIDEKTFNFKIMENVLGKQIINRPADNDRDKKCEKKFKPIVRYDPEDESHAKYEIKLENPMPKKKNDSKPKTVVIEDNLPPSVSNDIFYTVSENLTESLKTKEEFSLLKMLGRDVVEENEKKIDNSNNESIQIIQNKKYQLKTKNPFKYESSDDENDDNAEEYYTKTDSKSIRFPNEDNFFFEENDPRLLILKKEELLRSEKEEESNFNVRRRELKRIVRKKIKNIQRENGKWKANKSWKSHEKRKKV